MPQTELIFKPLTQTCFSSPCIPYLSECYYHTYTCLIPELSVGKFFNYSSSISLICLVFSIHTADTLALAIIIVCLCILKKLRSFMVKVITELYPKEISSEHPKKKKNPLESNLISTAVSWKSANHSYTDKFCPCLTYISPTASQVASLPPTLFPSTQFSVLQLERSFKNEFPCLILF